MDGIRARIMFNVRTDGYDITLLEREHGKTRYVLRPEPNGTWRREPLTEGGMVEPSLRFGDQIGREVLQSLAEQLAQLGFLQMNAAPQIGAMQAHIDDLREQSARLFRLADKD